MNSNKFSILESQFNTLNVILVNAIEFNYIVMTVGPSAAMCLIIGSRFLASLECGATD